MDYNYHTHTYRCHHAMGTEREYIENAIAGGIKYMGFSEHMPFCFPDGYESPYRMYVSDTPLYFSRLNELREEFKDKIEIKIGFELEFYPKHHKEMLANAINMGAEYLILGQHFLKNEYPELKTSSSKKLTAEGLTEYVETVLTAMDTGCFTYVAHPDVVYHTDDSELYRRLMRKICIKSAQSKIPLEINFLGIRTNRQYPYDEFWQIAGEEKAPVTFGFDAHDAKAACDKESLPRAMELVKKYSLNYIGRPKLILLDKFRDKIS